LSNFTLLLGIFQLTVANAEASIFLRMAQYSTFRTCGFWAAEKKTKIIPDFLQLDLD